MAIISSDPNHRPIINLNGPEGNAFVLMGYAKSYGKQLGMTNQQITELVNEMMISDYEHLIKTFDNTFGDYVDLVR